MSGTTGTQPPGSTTSLFDHALRLHRETPDQPLRRGGSPYPDEDAHRRRQRPKAAGGGRSAGRGVALLLDAHFARGSASPGELAAVCHDVHIPIHPDEHITAAAERADGRRARETGRWLVRHGTDRCSATLGLALIAAVGTADDIRRVQTIGLLSDWFGPLAAHALARLPEGAEAVAWLAERVTGWGRVYAVHTLCRLDDPVTRPWLLRRACDGDFLNAYFVGDVVRTTGLHEAATASHVDDEIMDHAGRILLVMTGSSGMGATLSRYPHAEAVLAAHLRHLTRTEPSAGRYCTAAWLAGNLGEDGDEASVGPARRWRHHRDGYLSLLARDDWCGVAREALAAKDPGILWLVETAWGRRLAAFAGRPSPQSSDRSSPQ